MLQVRATLLEPGQPCPATLLFNCPIPSIRLTINRIPFDSDNDDDHYEVLIKRQRNDKNYDTARNYDLFSIGSTVAVQWEDGETVD